MNKKFASFIFAVGLAVTAAPAFASCYHYCAVEYQACVSGGGVAEECRAELAACQADC